jgi:quercetin dioxygenase-like cupin family protein
MEERTKKRDDSLYPEMIRALPEIEVPIPGVRGWLLQGERHQAVFFEIEAGTRISPHSHCAQWGLMVEGEISLTIDGQTKLYGKGERYFIPAGAVHSATFPSRVNVIDVFDDPARYRSKT